MTAGLRRSAVAFSMAALLAVQPVVAVAAPVVAQQEQPAGDSQEPVSAEPQEGATETPTAGADSQQPAEAETPKAKATEEKPAGGEGAADESSIDVARGANGQTYASVQAAVDANESAITLLANTTENVVIPVGATIELYLNGFTLSGGTADKKAALTNNGTVTIKDSAGENKGQIIREDKGASGYYTIDNQGTMTIKSGSVYNQTGEIPKGSSLIRNAGGNSKATLNIEGGNIKHDGFIAVKNDDRGILNITGGTIEATGEKTVAGITYSASAVQNWCEANITAGTIKGAVAVWTSTWSKDLPASKTTVSGTAAVSGKIVVKQDESGKNNGKLPELDIKGGTLNVTGWSVFQSGDQKGIVKISGGTFEGDNASAAKQYLDAGCKIDADGTVAKSSNIATVAGQGYSSVQAAIDAAQPGDTVKLLANTDISEPIVVTKKITLDLDGYKIYNSKDIWNTTVSPSHLSLITVRDGGDLTITGNGTLWAKENDCYAIMLEAESSKLTVENGTFVGNVSAVYVVKGSASLEGGIYKLLQKNTNTNENPYDPQRYLINCKDEFFNDGAAHVVISGGTYEGFDPTKSPEKDAPSFLAPGLEASSDANGNFQVAAKQAAQVISAKDGKVTAYDTLADAVKNATAEDTVKLLKSSTEKVEVNKKLNFIGAAGVDFKGDLIFQAGAKGSTVKNVSFVVDADSEAQGLAASIHVLGTSDITIEGNTFSIPSRLWGVYGDGAYSDGKSWQPNSIYIGQSSNVTVKGNTFTLGRTNEQTKDAANPVESDATVAVNIAGQNVSSVTLDGNTMTVTEPAAAATKDASVSFLIANGNENDDPSTFGIKGLTVTNNKMTGFSNEQFNRFAGLSDVDGLTVTGNTLANLKYGIGRSSWQNKNDALANVSLSGNTYTNIYNTPITTEKDTFEASGALVSTNDGTMKDYATFADAVANAVEGNTIFLLGENAENVTIDKAVKVTSVGWAATYTGTMTVKAGATISGLHFVKDTNSIVLKSGTDGAQIMGNVFDVTRNEAVTQANAIYAIDGGVTNLTVVNNTFNAAGDSTVGLNIQNTGVENITLKLNTVNDTFGQSSLVNAFGKGMDNGGTEYGIKNLVVTDNTINGTYSYKGGDFERTTCATIRNVQGVTFENNTLNNVYIGLSYAQWKGYEQSKSTGITVNKNTATDSLVLSYLLPETTSHDVTYGTGENANLVKQAKYSKNAPVASTTTGQAFAGWYEDEACTKVATDTSKPAYAKWVDAEDAVAFDFMGGSLRMDYEGYDKTSLRFGYRTKVLLDGLKMKSAGWKFEIGGKTYETTAKNQIERDGWQVNNLVFTGVPKANYGTPIDVRMNIIYTTPDGTEATLSDTNLQTRSVKQVAECINASQNATAAEKAYANSLLNAMNNTTSEN